MCKNLSKKMKYKKESEKIMNDNKNKLISLFSSKEQIKIDRSDKDINLYCKLIEHKLHNAKIEEKEDENILKLLLSREKLFDGTINILNEYFDIGKYICKISEKNKRKAVNNNTITNYKLFACTNAENHQNGDNKIWFRDYNAAKNILRVMMKKVKENELGNFDRKVKMKEIEEENITQVERIRERIENGQKLHKKERNKIRFPVRTTGTIEP